MESLLGRWDFNVFFFNFSIEQVVAVGRYNEHSLFLISIQKDDLLIIHIL